MTAPTSAPAPTQVVLDHLARPYDPARVLSALLGIPSREARRRVGLAVATGAAADRLLDAMASIVRSLAIATTDRPERCYGELRGPVLWSETMSARSASAGDPGLFVCATTTKAYDTPENRILKAALATIRDAGADADLASLADLDDAGRHARHNAQRAGRLLEHRTLADVPLTRVVARSLNRTRAGSRRGTYQPAVGLIRAAADPLGAADVDAWATPGTRRQIEVLADALTAAERAGGAPLALRWSDGALTAGPVAYDHLGGVTVDGVLITNVDEIGPALGRAGLSASNRF